MSDELNQNQLLHEKNKGIVRVDIHGPSMVGKTAVGVLIAQALAKAFEEQSILASIKVASLEGDWELIRDGIQENEGELAKRLSNIENVLIVDHAPDFDGELIDPNTIGASFYFGPAL